MSKIIPKEQMSAYQRWEMETLEDPHSTVSSHVEFPTAEQVEQIQLQARQEGHQEGFREGRQEGYQEGFQEGMRQGSEQGYGEGSELARQEAQRLHELLAQVNEAVQDLDRNMAQQLMSLSLDIAKQMLRQALAVRPELVLAVVQEAINSLPQVNQHPQLMLHPQDAELVRSFLESELAHGHWRVVEDVRLAPGGCRLETAQSELDATMESRWQRVLESLGQNGEWLAPK